MKKIVGWVLFTHLAALIWMSLSYQSVPPKKPIVVKTVTLSPPKIQPTSHNESKSPPSETVAASIPPKKPELKKNPPPKKTVSSTTPKKLGPKPAPLKKNKEPSPKMQSLLQSIEESLNKIEQPTIRKKSTQTTDLPNKKKRLKIDDLDSGASIGYSDNYQDQLIDLLKDSLDLPDFGEVKLKLTLKKDGTIMELTIIEAKSQKNRIYLEKNLKTMHFPIFSGGIAKENHHIFTLTFCNQL